MSFRFGATATGGLWMERCNGMTWQHESDCEQGGTFQEQVAAVNS